MIVAADDMRDVHVVVVDDDREIIGRRAVRPRNHQVIELDILEDHPAPHLVLDHDLAEFVAGLPSRHKLSRTTTKAILIEVRDGEYRLIVRGEAPTTVELAGRRRRWLEPQLEDLLGKLRELHWVHMTREGGWALARRLSDATLLDLYASRVFELPREGDPDWPADAPLAALLKRANTGVGEVLRVPLAEFRLQRAESVAIRAPADQSTTSTSM